MGTIGRIDLVIPGLFGPIPVLPGDLPELPSLSRLLGRAHLKPARGSDPIAVLFDRFGVALDPDLDPPSAPFSRLIDVPSAASGGYLLHADPVHLRPDRDRLLLFDARHLGLEREEADSLAELFNGHFATDGLRLETPTVDRWYLHAEPAPRLRTRTLADMVGRGVDRSYLAGEDGLRWMGWLNEVQMLFHHAEVNQRREMAGRPTVSGIWPWGGGSLPAVMPRCRYSAVFAVDSLTLGLAKAAMVLAHPLPDRPQGLLAGEWRGRTLLFWDTLQSAVLDADAGAWTRELSRLVTWLDELLGLLKEGQVEEVALFPCDGTRMVVTRGALRRFWRRSVGIASRLQGKPRG